MNQTVKTHEEECAAKRRARIKSCLPKEATEEELDQFIHVCDERKLDPVLKQIYGAKRKNKQGEWQPMTIECRIDGLRLIADRTKRYAPGKEPVFHDSNGKLVACTSFVKKQTADGTWHEVASTVYFSEYDQNNFTWQKMPRTMLAKVAEAHALRKAFPGELSGLYSEDEMPESKKEETSAPFEPLSTPKEEKKQEPSKFVTELQELQNQIPPTPREFPKDPLNKKQIAYLNNLLNERGVSYQKVKETWSLCDMDKLLQTELPELVNTIKANFQSKAAV